MKIQAIKTRIYRPNEELFSFVTKYIKKLPEKSVVVVTSKIVALSEGRFVEGNDDALRDKLVKEESEFSLRTKYAWLTIKDGTLMASAGIDRSNANGKTILLPKDSFESAKELRQKLKKHYAIKKLGVLITDSRLLPLRAGIVGVALGYSGFKGIRDYRKTKDIFGRPLKVSRTDMADALATSAVICMGEGKEQKPLAIITNAPIEFTEYVNKGELFIDPAEDIYRPFFKTLDT